MNRQDELNLTLWLATQAGRMELSCPLGIRVMSLKEHDIPYNKSFIDQACSVRMAGYWPRSFFCASSSRSINTQKKNLANIQPSWPPAYILQLTLLHVDHCLAQQRSASFAWHLRAIQHCTFSNAQLYAAQCISRSFRYVHPRISMLRDKRGSWQPFWILSLSCSAAFPHSCSRRCVI